MCVYGCMYIHIYQPTKFGDSMNCDLKDIFKYASCPMY